MKLQNFSSILVAAVAATLLTAPQRANAETIFGITGANELVSFDSATPNSLLTTVAITGASIINIDFRPATGGLYGLDGINDLYLLNRFTGVASFVGTPGISGGFDYGFDFNPTVDRIRVVTDDGQNFRVNPNDGSLTATDGALDYTAGDPNDAATPALSGAAYTNNVATATTTTLYGIDANLDILARSTNANGGLYVTQGDLGLDVTGLLGFDISGPTGVAYASLSTDGFSSSLYTIDLATGAATFVGGIGSASGTTILDISAVPEPTTTVLVGLGALALLARRRRIA